MQPFLDATHHIASPKVTDNEQKTENGKEYVSFKVESYLKRDLGKEDIQTTVVWRRYTDFELFRQYLVSTIPSAVIPPIPEKTVRTLHSATFFFNRMRTPCHP